MRYRDPLKQILERTRWYWDHDGVPSHVRKAFRKVLQCRTPALGAEVFASEDGELTVYHTCKSRACPSCGHWATMKWQRLAALPPVVYKGITFTMPKALWRLFRDNKPLADALPALAAGAISALILGTIYIRALPIPELDDDFRCSWVDQVQATRDSYKSLVNWAGEVIPGAKGERRTLLIKVQEGQTWFLKFPLTSFSRLKIGEFNQLNCSKNRVRLLQKGSRQPAQFLCIQSCIRSHENNCL